MMFFTFNGENTAEYGVYISGEATYNTPDRLVETVRVAGRNGEIIVDDANYSNIELKYPCFIKEDLEEKLGAFAAMLASQRGYGRLEDTYHPQYFRKAHFERGMTIKTSPYNKAGSFEVAFNCMPQKFLKDGEKKIELMTDGKILNPTKFESKPLLRVYGTGKITIQGQEITIRSADEYTDIDCEIMEAYKGTVNCNENVMLPDNLVLVEGANQITLTGVTKVEITPRWWTL
jgi:phage-related protein